MLYVAKPISIFLFLRRWCVWCGRKLTNFRFKYDCSKGQSGMTVNKREKEKNGRWRWQWWNWWWRKFDLTKE